MAMAERKDNATTGLEDEAAFDDSLVTLEPVSDGTVGEVLPTPAPGERASWAGKLLGRFRLLRPLGAGRMGLVIQAMDVHLQRIVALKVLRRRITGVEGHARVGQFLREARAAAKIEHPNVVRIYEINDHEGWWYIAMEMLEGDSLKRIVGAVGALPPAQACPVVADAATALAAAHELGIIHRDVKPANLMIARDGRCKLTDFGLVRLDDPDDPFDFTDMTVGTPQFLAPEAIARKHLTPAVDVYGLGATLYYALAGSAPYTGRSIKEILDKHLHAPAPDVRQLRGDCPQSLSELIRRMMAKQPTERPSAGDVAAALRAEAIAFRPDESGVVVGGSGLVARAAVGEAPAPPGARTAILPPEPRPRRLLRSRRLWVATAAGAAAAAAAVVVLLALLGGNGAAVEPAALQGRFPNAPETYGVRPAGSVPQPAAHARPPPFSWLGKVDPGEARFAASRTGRHFWPIDSPAAALIRAEDFVGYRTAEEARADGKAPAP